MATAFPEITGIALDTSGDTFVSYNASSPSSGQEQAVAEIRSMLNTLARRPDVRAEWQPMFRDGYLGVLREAGQAIAEGPQDLLFIEPEVFHAPAIKEAVDHEG